MSAVDRILSAHGLLGQKPPQRPEEDVSSEIVLAVEDALRAALVELASDPDNDGDDDSTEEGDKDNDNDHLDHATFKAMKKRGMPDKAAAAICAKADAKKVKASASVAGALIALSGLAVNRTQGDWVERTAYDPNAIGLAADAQKPYGDVEYADPGYQEDGKHRYPLDAKHIHAAISYFSKAGNRGSYTAEQVKAMWAKIKAAASRLGVEMSPATGS
jgi:hypothetical protein